jgi:predicted ATPase
VYIFKRALLEDVLYNAVVKWKRQQFHRRIAEVLEARFPQTTETRPEVLALHFTEAGWIRPVVGYLLKAGLQSRERSAEQEAIGHLRTGLALLVKLDESPARDAQEFQFLNALGTAHQSAGGYGAPEAGPVFAGHAGCATESGNRCKGSRPDGERAPGIVVAATTGAPWSWDAS